jgi:hypothetical protein
LLLSIIHEQQQQTLSYLCAGGSDVRYHIYTYIL